MVANSDSQLTSDSVASFRSLKLKAEQSTSTREYLLHARLCAAAESPQRSDANLVSSTSLSHLIFRIISLLLCEVMYWDPHFPGRETEAVQVYYLVQ